jgi:GNAT superfamily N-acetyltransferase
MRLRDYLPEDRDACLALFDGNTPRYFDPSERASFERWLAAPGGPWFVLVDEHGAVVACGGYVRDRGGADDAGAAELAWGMVRRDLHGRGLGRRLTEERIARAEADPAIDALLLFTTQRSQGFYARMGFVVTRVTPEGIGPGLDRVDMRRPLARRGAVRAERGPGVGDRAP